MGIDLDKLKKPKMKRTTFWVDEEKYSKLKKKLSKKKIPISAFFNEIIEQSLTE